MRGHFEQDPLEHQGRDRNRHDLGELLDQVIDRVLRGPSPLVDSVGKADIRLCGAAILDRTTAADQVAVVNDRCVTTVVIAGLDNPAVRMLETAGSAKWCSGH